MTLPIDIFHIDDQGPRWLQSAASLEEAESHVRKLARASSAEYLLVNQVTGQKVPMKADGGKPVVGLASPSPSTGISSD